MWTYELNTWAPKIQDQSMFRYSLVYIVVIVQVRDPNTKNLMDHVVNTLDSNGLVGPRTVRLLPK